VFLSAEVTSVVSPQLSSLHLNGHLLYSCKTSVILLWFFFRYTSDITTVRTIRDLIASSLGSCGLSCYWPYGRQYHGFTATSEY
jgi:hypothetical protein